MIKLKFKAPGPAASAPAASPAAATKEILSGVVPALVTTEKPQHSESELFCVCRRPYVEGEFMFACDGDCGAWFHPACLLGKSMDAAEFGSKVSKFVCQNCSGTGKAVATWKAEAREGRDGKERTTQIDPSQILERKKSLRALNATGGTAKVTDSGLQLAVDYFALVERHADLIRPAPYPSLASGYDLTVDDLRERGLPYPLLIRSTVGMGLRIPESLTAREVVDYLGPDYPMAVIDVPFQAAEEMSLDQFASYLETPEKDRTRVLNSISVEFSGTPLADLVTRPRILEDLDWEALGVWGDGMSEGEKPRQIALYWLCGAKGSYTDFHLDFGGTSVFYAPVSGKKTFLFLPPEPAILAAYQVWTSSPDQHTIFLPSLIPRKVLDEAGGCIQMSVEPGQCLFIPGGWIHAVLTPEDSSIVGGNFLHLPAARLQIQVAELEEQSGVKKQFRLPGGHSWTWRAAAFFLEKLQNGERFGTAEIRGLKSLASWVLERSAEIRRLEASSDPEDRERAVEERKLIPKEIGRTKRLGKDIKDEVKRAKEEGRIGLLQGLGIQGMEEVEKKPAEEESGAELFDLDAGDWVPAKDEASAKVDPEIDAAVEGALFDLDAGDWIPANDEAPTKVDPDIDAAVEGALFDLDAGDWISAEKKKEELKPSPPKFTLKFKAAVPAPPVVSAALPKVAMEPSSSSSSYNSFSAFSTKDSPVVGLDSDSGDSVPPAPLDIPAPAKPTERPAAKPSKSSKLKKRPRASSLSSEDLSKFRGDESESFGSASDAASQSELSDLAAGELSEDEEMGFKPKPKKAKRAFQGMDITVKPAVSAPPAAKTASSGPAPPKKKKKASSAQPAARPAKPQPKAEPEPTMPQLGLIGLQMAKQRAAEAAAAEQAKQAAAKKGSVFDRLKNKASKLGRGDYVRGKKATN